MNSNKEGCIALATSFSNCFSPLSSTFLPSSLASSTLYFFLLLSSSLLSFSLLPSFPSISLLRSLLSSHFFLPSSGHFTFISPSVSLSLFYLCHPFPLFLSLPSSRQNSPSLPSSVKFVGKISPLPLL